MKTAAFSATLAARIFFAVLGQLPYCYAIAEDNGTTANPEGIDRPFVRSFGYGPLATRFIDPDRPPVLELVIFSWDGRELVVSAHYHNVDSSEPKKVEGRQIIGQYTDGPIFWPYASLEVSNYPDEGWRIIGSSPSGANGMETVVLMYPDRAAYVERSAPASPSCHVDITPFREFIGKFQYGRVMLRSGGASQTIALTDLLAPEPSSTPPPPAGSSPASR